MEPALSDARSVVLERIRTATAGAAPEAVVRTYRQSGSRDHAERVALFCERVGDYRAEVLRVSPADVREALAEAAAKAGASRLAVPRGLPTEWRPDGVELVEDDGLTPQELDAVDGVITGSTVAVAETGTIVLSGAPDEGRRALSLLPDLHLCLVRAESIVELVPEAVELLAPLVRNERRPLTLVSGPSATSDIELKRVEGVHGPRRLVVVVVGSR